MAGTRGRRGGVGSRKRAFNLHFTNIRGILSNFQSIELHLSTKKPNVLLLSETQISKDSYSSELNISNHNLFIIFAVRVESVPM